MDDSAFEAGRYAAADVHYPVGGGATAALVIADIPTFATLMAERTASVAEAATYRPGELFARELPPLRAVLADAGRLDFLLVDGYVHLDPYGRPGLGAHGHAEFGMPVIGVAKTVFRTATHAIQVHRGRATRPLYVTAIGIPAERAATVVQAMSGRYRLPDALRRVDALSRGDRSDIRGSSEPASSQPRCRARPRHRLG